MPSSASGSADTLPGSAMGTPAYMSPEQARGELDQLGPRSDVYSLGATLYCLLTGKPAFEGGDIGAVLRACNGATSRVPARSTPTIDRALEEICVKAMSQRPEERYDSCKALADDIERWMADEAVIAWEEPWSRKLVRWLTRHRTGVTAAGAAMLMAVVGLGAVSGVQVRANGELKRANTRVFLANTELKQANDNVTRANEELQAANVRERQQFNLAMDAIKLFHGDISKDLLLKQHQFEKLRGKLLRGAADFYGRLEKLLKGREDQESRAALGRAYEELGELMINIGNSKEALATFQKVIEVRRTLSQELPADDRIKLDLARNLRTSGYLLEGISDRPAALAAYEKSLAIVKGLNPAEGMTEPLYLVDSRITHSIGWLYHANGKEEESVAWLRKASEILDHGIASRPAKTGSLADKESRLSLVNTLNSLSGPLGALGRASESLADQWRALNVARALSRDDPEDPETRNSVAATYFNIGGLYRSMSRPAEALLGVSCGAGRPG